MSVTEPLGTNSDLLGRAPDLSLLRETWQGVVGTRGGRGVLVTGATGVGKTTLTRTFLDQIRNGPHAPLIIWVNCSEGRSALRPYGPFRDALRLLADPRDGADLGDVVRDRAPGWLREEEVAEGPQALLEEYIDVWRALAADRPVVLVVDDCQWGDPASLDLLAALGGQLSDMRMLLVCILDVEAEAGATECDLQERLGGSALEIQLRELAPPFVRKLLERILEGPPSRGLVEWVVRITRGNPLHVEQLMALAREQNVIRRRFFRYTHRRSELPSGVTRIEDVLDRRLNGIEPGRRWVLEAASLASEVIDPAVVARLVEGDEESVLETLREAERGSRFLESAGERRRSDGSWAMRFRFRHPSFRGALQARVPAGRRNQTLRKVAEALQLTGGDDPQGRADEIAVLYLGTSDRAEIFEWCRRAADLAERLYASQATESFLKAAALAASDSGARARVEIGLARLYAAQGREGEAEELLEAVYERCREQEDPAAEVEAGARLGWLQLGRGVEAPQLAALAGRLVDSARKSEGPRELVAAMDFAAAVAVRVGRAEEALLMGEEALHVAEGVGEPELVARAAHRLAYVHVSFESPEAGRALAERAGSIFRKLGDSARLVECHDLLGLADFRAGDWDGAIDHWTTALEELADAGAAGQRISMQTNLAELLTLRGEFDRARHLLDSALALAGELNDPAHDVRVRARAARLELERGDFPGVIALTEEIREILPEVGAWREDFLTTAIRALAYLETGDELQAWQEAARLEQLYRGKEGWFEGRAEGDAVRMRVIDLDSDPGLASVIAGQGIREMKDKDPYGEAFLQYHRARVTARTDPKEARTAAERAVALFTDLGAEPMRDRAERLLARLSGEETAPPRVQEAEGDLTEEKLDSWFDSLEG